ncbi:MAG: T9SS type A sorting domain-containing protein [Ignavibacteriales bacterium]|nr:T9SS type A sorting domain-containing protein [Ignavibacteriales bacterium]
MTLVAMDANLFAGTYQEGGGGAPSGGVFLSTNNGTSWVNTGLINTAGTNLFAGTDGGVFLSANNGTSWSAVNNGLTNGVRCLVVSGTNLFAGTRNGVFLSTNNGTSWVNTGLINTDVSSFAVSGTKLFAGTYDGDVFLSANNGTSWSAVHNGLTNTSVWSLAVSGTNLFAGLWGSGVFLSTNSGTSWTAVNTGLTNTTVYSFAVLGTNLFAGTYGNGVWRRPLSEMITDVKQSTSPLPETFSLSQNYPNPFNPSTTISFSLPTKSFVTLKIFDVLGKQVSEVISEELLPGNYTRQWNASDLTSGVYFYRLSAVPMARRDLVPTYGRLSFDFSLPAVLFLLKAQWHNGCKPTECMAVMFGV